MAREFAREFYDSTEWKLCRDRYAKSVGRLCEECLRQGIYKPGKIVHHKTEITPENITKPEVTMSFNNLELVCMDCHAKLHGRKKRYFVDEFGNVTTTPPIQNNL